MSGTACEHLCGRADERIVGLAFAAAAGAAVAVSVPHVYSLCVVLVFLWAGGLGCPRLVTMGVCGSSEMDMKVERNQRVSAIAHSNALIAGGDIAIHSLRVPAQQG